MLKLMKITINNGKLTIGFLQSRISMKNIKLGKCVGRQTPEIMQFHTQLCADRLP